MAQRQEAASKGEVNQHRLSLGFLVLRPPTCLFQPGLFIALSRRLFALPGSQQMPCIKHHVKFPKKLLNPSVCAAGDSSSSPACALPFFFFFLREQNFPKSSAHTLQKPVSFPCYSVVQLLQLPNTPLETQRFL